MTIDLNDIESVKLLRPQPGDIVIVQHPGKLSGRVSHNACNYLYSILPKGCHVVILEDGADIKLLRPEKAEAYVVEGGKEDS